MNKTQNEQILRVLSRRRNKWVGLPTLARESGSLSPATRISNLRRAGHKIENKVERVKRQGQYITASYYKLHE